MIKLKYSEEVYKLNGFLKEAVDSYQTLDFMFDTISQEEKDQFMGLLNNLLRASEVYDKTNYAAFHSSSGVDFSTDLQKAMTAHNNASIAIDGFIKNMNIKYSKQSDEQVR